MEKAINIVMADDHPIVRQGLRRIVEHERDLRIVAETGNGAEAVELIDEHRPQIALLDIDMPGMDGFAVLRELRRRELETGIIFLTMLDDDEVFETAIDLGAQGYVLKDSAADDIVSAIRTVLSGRSFVSPTLSGVLLKRRRKTQQFQKDVPALDQLTATERRVLRLIADEKTSKEIASALFVSYRTIEAHRANISRKLGLKGSLALVRFATAHRSEL